MGVEEEALETAEEKERRENIRLVESKVNIHLTLNPFKRVLSGARASVWTPSPITEDQGSQGKEEDEEGEEDNDGEEV